MPNLLMLSGDATVARGQQGAFYQMLSRFSAHWDRIDIISPGGPDAATRTVYGNVHLHPSPWPKALTTLHILRKGRELLAERDYALVTSQDFGFFYIGLGAWLLTRGTGLPYVSEIHHVEGYPLAVTAKERLYRALARVYVPWVARRAAAIRIVNHVEMPELLRRWGVPEDRILVLPSLYMDYDVFRPLPDEAKQVDVLFVGRLVANKGLFCLLEALVQVRATHPQVTLGLRGDGPLRGALERRIEALGLADHVAWLPRQEGPDGLARLYNRARMLVCASTAEGGPRVTVEAMACGVPVISTPVGMMRELIDDGQNGLLFQWEADQLAAHIRRLLDDEPLRERLAAAGRESVQGFEAETIIANYARGYHDLIRRLGT